MSESLSKVNVLIVDDEAEDLELMSDILKKEGYHIFKASSGASALEILEKNNIQIVLLDVLMPDMTGYHTCKKIRERFKQNPIQIVLVSGLTADHFLEQAIEVGSDDFIYKPVNILELQRRIKVALFRYKNQMKLFKEKEHLKEAVAQKEKYSSKIKKEKEEMLKKNLELTDTNKELKKVVEFDDLTELYNRKVLFERIDSEIARANSKNIPLTGIMMDIDHFKKVNDNYGHQVGDIVLKGLALRLKSSLRVDDLAGRYGGEEFFIILANTTLGQGHNIGERFRKKLERYKIQYKNIKIKVSVSMGIAQYRPGESRDSWIDRADKAMYRAKHLGRNCIVHDEEHVFS